MKNAMDEIFDVPDGEFLEWSEEVDKEIKTLESQRKIKNLLEGKPTSSGIVRVSELYPCENALGTGDADE